jgi:hypothetical protein
MKHYTYAEPTSDTDFSPKFITISEAQIIDEYWDYWIRCMENRGYDISDYTKEDCIMDWRVIHWAWESDKFGNHIEKNGT